jgi:hypothetical protein
MGMIELTTMKLTTLSIGIISACCAIITGCVSPVIPEKTLTNSIRRLNSPAITSPAPQYRFTDVPLPIFLNEYAGLTGKKIAIEEGLFDSMTFRWEKQGTTVGDVTKAMEAYLTEKNIALISNGTNELKAVKAVREKESEAPIIINNHRIKSYRVIGGNQPLIDKYPEK